MASKKLEEFREVVVARISELQPAVEISVIDDENLLVDKKRLDLESLYRSALLVDDPDAFLSEFLEQFLSVDLNVPRIIPPDYARSRIMPRLHSDSAQLRMPQDLLVLRPFTEGVVVLAVLDLPDMSLGLGLEQILQWGISEDEVHSLALENLDRMSKDLEPSWLRNDEKEENVLALISTGDKFDAARIILPDLHGRLSPTLGQDFFVATPARDCLIAAPRHLERPLKERAEELFQTRPHPITDRLFLVVRDGVLLH